MDQQQAFQRIIDVYFPEHCRRIDISAGTRVLEQASFNDRLFWVRKGLLIGYVHDERSNMSVEVFRVSKGMFFGVHSFFARTLASSTVIAEQDSELAWIDLNTVAVEAETYGSLNEQFMPVIVHELAQRQMQAGLAAVEKEQALQQLYATEQLTTLGQLAAGIAHELNNAIGVLSCNTERIEQKILELVQEVKPYMAPFWQLGACKGQVTSSSDVRKRGKQLQTRYQLPWDQAKQLACALPKGEVPDIWLADLPQALTYWDIGRDIHDMRLAAKHAANIVCSVRQLGGGDQEKRPGVDINETLQKSLALLQSNLRGVNVTLQLASLPSITASITELVQVWINIIKNACDAMDDTLDPRLDITTALYRNRLLVTISNNGPVIAEPTRRQIFQPNFTTKKGGLSFGLGLGLSIVQRLVNSYSGTIVVKSEIGKTTFRIKLPIG